VGGRKSPFPIILAIASTTACNTVQTVIHVRTRPTCLLLHRTNAVLLTLSDAESKPQEKKNDKQAAKPGDLTDSACDCTIVNAFQRKQKEKNRKKAKKSVTIIKLLMIVIQIREHYQVIISIIVIFKLYTDKIKCKKTVNLTGN